MDDRRRLCSLLAAVLPGPTDEATRQALAHLRRSLEAAAPQAPRLHLEQPGPHAALVEAALAAARPPMMAVAGGIRRIGALLDWFYHYPPRPEAPELDRRIAFAELIGPDGCLAAPACRIGFTLMAPHTFYPPHRHPAVELYVPLIGKAAWLASSGERQVPPGGLVLHAANEPHATRTGDSPLLALYAWQGDLETPAAYL